MIDQIDHPGEGFARVYENSGWTLAMKNACPANGKASVTSLERHNETDEIFILLCGEAVMMEGHVKDNVVVRIEERPMFCHKAYIIPQGVWHNTYMFPGAKFVIVENVDTSYDNTDVLSFGDEVPREVKDHG